jgi:hypothetical protein
MDEEENLNLKPLKHIATSYMRDNLFKEKEIEVEYSPGMLAIGHRIRNGKPCGIYYLDLREACRIVAIGLTRSGKSWIARRFMDTISDAGNNVVHMFDPKNEMYSSEKPLQPKFHKLLMENEKPKSSKVVVFRPTFFKQLMPESYSDAERDKAIKPGQYWFSMNVNKWTQGDFMDLIKAKSMGEAQQSIMEDLYKKMRKHMEGGGEFSFEYMFKEIDDMEDMKESQKLSLKRRLKPLLSSYFYEARHQVDIIDLLKDGFIPVFNMEGFDSFSDCGFEYISAFLSIVHREIVEAKKLKLLDKIWFDIDECARVFGIEKDTFFKKEIITSFEVNTAYDINYFILTQFLPSLPERIIKSCRYIMIPARADLDTFKIAFAELGLARNQQMTTNDATYFKNRMNTRLFDWCILDRTNNTREIVRFFAPLSRVLESGE